MCMVGSYQMYNMSTVGQCTPCPQSGGELQTTEAMGTTTEEDCLSELLNEM